jgi:hypothetical protein
LHGAHNRGVRVASWRYQHVDGAVHEVLDGSNDVLCAVVSVARQVESAATESVDEGSYFLVCVHDLDILSQFMFGNYRLNRIDAFHVVRYEIQKECFGVLCRKR